MFDIGGGYYCSITVLVLQYYCNMTVLVLQREREREVKGRRDRWAVGGVNEEDWRSH